MNKPSSELDEETLALLDLAWDQIDTNHTGVVPCRRFMDVVDTLEDVLSLKRYKLVSQHLRRDSFITNITTKYPNDLISKQEFANIYSKLTSETLSDSLKPYKDARFAQLVDLDLESAGDALITNSNMPFRSSALAASTPLERPQLIGDAESPSSERQLRIEQRSRRSGRFSGSEKAGTLLIGRNSGNSAGSSAGNSAGNSAGVPVTGQGVSRSTALLEQRLQALQSRDKYVNNPISSTGPSGSSGSSGPLAPSALPPAKDFRIGSNASLETEISLIRRDFDDLLRRHFALEAQTEDLRTELDRKTSEYRELAKRYVSAVKNSPLDTLDSVVSDQAEIITRLQALLEKRTRLQQQQEAELQKQRALAKAVRRGSGSADVPLGIQVGPLKVTGVLNLLVLCLLGVVFAFILYTDVAQIVAKQAAFAPIAARLRLRSGKAAVLVARPVFNKSGKPPFKPLELLDSWVRRNALRKLQGEGYNIPEAVMNLAG